MREERREELSEERKKGSGDKHETGGWKEESRLGPRSLSHVPGGTVDLPVECLLRHPL